jgi:hypothetical protein
VQIDHIVSAAPPMPGCIRAGHNVNDMPLTVEAWSLKRWVAS